MERRRANLLIRVVIYHVYIIRSLVDNSLYIGFTKDVDARIALHNAGKSTYTATSKPWRLIAVFSLEDKQKAIEFERYLKTASGRAFLHKRILL